MVCFWLFINFQCIKFCMKRILLPIIIIWFCVINASAAVFSRTDVTLSQWQVKICTNAFAVDITGAYAVGDQWSDLIEVTNAFRTDGGSATLSSFSYRVPGATKPGVYVMVFSRPITVGATNAAFALSNDDAMFCLGQFYVTATYDYTVMATNNVGTVRNIGMPLSNTWTNKNLWLLMIANGTTTNTVATHYCTTGLIQD